MSHSSAGKYQCQIIPSSKQSCCFPEHEDMMSKPVCPYYMQVKPKEQNNVQKSF